MLDREQQIPHIFLNPPEPRRSCTLAPAHTAKACACARRSGAMAPWCRPPRRLTPGEHQLIRYRYANPQLTVRQISGILLLQPGELEPSAAAQGGTRAAACPCL